MTAPTGSPTGLATSARSVRSRYAVAGLAAGALGLAVATGLAVLFSTLGLTGGTPSPLLAVGDAFVDATPSWLKDFAIATFGTADKAVLIAGMAVVLIVVFAGIGLLARTRPARAQIGYVAVAAVALAAVLGRPGAGPLDAVPLVAGAGVGLWSLRGADSAGSGPSRRSLFELAGSLLALGVFAPVSGRGAGAARAAREAVRLPQATPPRPTGAADLGIAGVSPWIVPNAEFYRIDTAIVVPRLSTEDWSVRVWGEVDREVTLTWAELLAKPLVQRHTTLSCVSNEVGGSLVGNALWTGWPVRELLALAGPRPGADMVLSRSADGWTAGTPLGALTDGRDALVAIAMNGEPLPFEHGFPVRLVVPGLYGYVSATKWLRELKVTRFADDRGYWTPRGWSALGPVKTQSRIDVPRAGARVTAGPVAVAGVAWAMNRGITGVQVRVDDGPWQDARLADEPTLDSWRQWVFQWDAPEGSHTLTVRARDTTGEWQTDRTAPPAPNGATGHHSVVARVG